MGTNAVYVVERYLPSCKRWLVWSAHLEIKTAWVAARKAKAEYPTWIGRRGPYVPKFRTKKYVTWIAVEVPL